MSTPAPAKRRAPQREFTLRGLKKHCLQFRATLLDFRLATAEEIAPWMPGGAENLHRGYDAWVYAFGHLTYFNRRGQDRIGDSQQVREDELARVVALAAMAQPEAVTLSDGAVRHVHPKSFAALNVLEGLDMVVQRAQAATMRLTRDAEESLPEDAFVLLHERLAQSRAVRCWAWVLTHPGAGVPWPEDAGALDLPEWTGLLAPQDLLLIDAAHRRVNGERLAVMAAAFPPKPGERSRLSIGGMLSAYAHEHGQPPRDVMRLLSIGEVVAGAIAAQEAYDVATRNAKHEHRDDA